MTDDRVASEHDDGDLFVARAVAKAYGHVRALRHADIAIRQGSVHGLVGHNGAGKSTLVKIISGLVEPDAGELSFAGQRVDGADRRAAIGHGINAVPQELTILPGMTVADNVSVGDEPRHGPWVMPRAMRERAKRTLGQLGLDLDPNEHVDTLRPSQQRTVMIAAGVSRSCRLLILDEPTASLGTDEAEPLLRLIESLPRLGITVLYISHRLDEVARLCDRVTIMRDGSTISTLERGQFDTRALITHMVDELPDRVPRAASAAKTATKIAVGGMWGQHLRGVDLEFAAGAVTGLTGLVGSGADELVAILGGAARPLDGTIVIDGKPVAFATPADAVAAGVGFIAATRALSAFPTLTIRENVLASSMSRVARLGILAGGRERRIAAECVAPFGLAERVNQPLSTLSGGNQQKVILRRLLAAELDILVVDDPTVGVDVRARADLHALLMRAAEHGATVIVRCSEPEELLDLADTVYVMAGGKLARTFKHHDIDLTRLLEASASSGHQQPVEVVAPDSTADR